MICPYCQAQVRDNIRYCNNCGRLINPSVNTGGGTTTGTSRSLTVGSRLQGGRYVVKRILGEGGMGAALLATDNRLDNKLVVIKELISENTDPEKVKEDERNFKREVVTLAHLDHPLIPSVTDNFEEGLRYFMVQEYVEGENLEERIDKLNQSMKERDVLIYASQILDVLDYLEQQNPPIVHRDIKPANIIISTKDKRAHLVDFGIARADEVRNVKRKQTAALGTPGYAPPEQYQGNADPRSDLYALAATMHHLLTNRDPRNHPPFTYPPVSTLNPDVSADTERVLTRALNNAPDQRYQSAAAMKNDIDEILLRRFGVSGSISSYLLGASGAFTAAGAAGTAGASASTSANQPTVASQPTQRQQQRPPLSTAARGQQAAPPPYYPPPVQPGTYPQQPQQRRGGSGLRNFLLLLLVLFLIFAVFAAFSYFRNAGIPGTGGSNVTSTPTAGVQANGIGVTKVGNEYIGISDGTFAFDTSRKDGDLKQQAAQKLAQHDSNGAQALLQQAVAEDTNDAEALIYLENIQVQNSGSPYITIVVGTMLTGTNVTVGRDDLQGAYVAQKEYNDGSKLAGGMLVRLLIASSGSAAPNAATVAQQVVQVANSDQTFVGVMGWPFSSHTLKAIDTLSQAGIPMVSPTASSDELTGKSKFFFRVAPSNQEQGVAGAKYAEQTLHAKNVALFYDPLDPYSNSLAQDFKKQFTADGNTIAVEKHYTVGKPATLVQPLNDALTHNPDLIYFSGYASDASTLLTDLPTSGQFATLPVLGGDALYELGAYQSSSRAAGFRLHFTSFAYPDEWDVLGYGAQKPAFFTDYANYFDPNRQHTGSPYGYTRPGGDVMLSYDAMLAILQGSNNVLSHNQGRNFKPGDLQQGLTQISGANAIQGVSGQIAFDAQGNPVNKAFVILFIDQNGFIMMEKTAEGTFLKAP
jgi:eukaryotic-like serine/threonine-protein kinase